MYEPSILTAEIIELASANGIVVNEVPNDGIETRLEGVTAEVMGLEFADKVVPYEVPNGGIETRFGESCDSSAEIPPYDPLKNKKMEKDCPEIVNSAFLRKLAGARFYSVGGWTVFEKRQSLGYHEPIFEIWDDHLTLWGRGFRGVGLLEDIFPRRRKDSGS